MKRRWYWWCRTYCLSLSPFLFFCQGSTISIEQKRREDWIWLSRAIPTATRQRNYPQLLFEVTEGFPGRGSEGGWLEMKEWRRKGKLRPCSVCMVVLWRMYSWIKGREDRGREMVQNDDEDDRILRDISLSSCLGHPLYVHDDIWPDNCYLIPPVIRNCIVAPSRDLCSSWLRLSNSLPSSPAPKHALTDTTYGDLLYVCMRLCVLVFATYWVSKSIFSFEFFSF